MANIDVVRLRSTNIGTYYCQKEELDRVLALGENLLVGEPLRLDHITMEETDYWNIPATNCPLTDLIGSEIYAS